MNKILTAILVVMMIALPAPPASAADGFFRGYWRKITTGWHRLGGDSNPPSRDLDAGEPEIHLNYTAKSNGDLEFTSRFLFDEGPDENGPGDFGMDQRRFGLKQARADFDWLGLNFRVGMQGLDLHRGFLMNDDFAGAVVRYRQGPLEVPFTWVKMDSEYADYSGMGEAEDDSLDYYILYPSYAIGDAMTVKGLVAYLTQEEGETDAYFAGLDFDATFDALSLWFTGIYEGGDHRDMAVDAYLLAAGGSYDFGAFGVHSELFYVTGDDDPSDGETGTFTLTRGQRYDWARLMGPAGQGGEGRDSFGASADMLSNVMAFNVGVRYTPIKKLDISADFWYAQLKEALNGEDELGMEVDLKASYRLIGGLSLDVIAAYLFAGDAIPLTDEEGEDPYEITSRMSLNF